MSDLDKSENKIMHIFQIFGEWRHCCLAPPSVQDGYFWIPYIWFQTVLSKLVLSIMFSEFTNTEGRLRFKCLWGSTFRKTTKLTEIHYNVLLMLRLCYVLMVHLAGNKILVLYQCSRKRNCLIISVFFVDGLFNDTVSMWAKEGSVSSMIFWKVRGYKRRWLHAR